MAMSRSPARSVWSPFGLKIISPSSGVMATIERISDKPYKWRAGEAPLEKVANVEKKMPRDFITADGFHITQKCRNYLAPLIAGEAYPPYEGGLPKYVRLKNAAVRKKTAGWTK